MRAASRKREGVRRQGGSNILSFAFTFITVACMGTSFFLLSRTTSTSTAEVQHATAAAQPAALHAAALSNAAPAAPRATMRRDDIPAHLPKTAAAPSAPPKKPPAPPVARPRTALAGRPAVGVVKKKIVPLATPQGYDAAAKTLTLGVWQASGVSYDPADDSPALAQRDGQPAPGLMHRATPPSNEGMVMGLAAYPNDILGKFERFVGTLRFTGYQVGPRAGGHRGGRGRNGTGEGGAAGGALRFCAVGGPGLTSPHVVPPHSPLVACRGDRGTSCWGYTRASRRGSGVTSRP